MAMTDGVSVKLSDNDRQERQDSLLYHLGEAQRLEAKKAADSKATQVLIAVEWAECYRLRRVLLDDAEHRLQGDLRFGDELVPSVEQATEALAALAVVVVEPVPSEPHGFRQSIGAEESVCAFCGSTEADPVHACDHGVALGQSCPGCGTTDETAHQPHPYTITSESDACLTCGGTVEAAPIHRGGRPSATCPACRSGECRVHPHAFVPGDPENKCAKCQRGRKAKTHRAPELVAVADPDIPPVAFEDSLAYRQALEDEADESDERPSLADA